MPLQVHPDTVRPAVPAKGSKFIVTLEQDIVDEKELGTFTLASRAKLHDEGLYRQSFEAPDAHILVVDDNEMNLMVEPLV